jgi:ankyrin repeat protein
MPTSLNLPERPNLRHLKDQAKDLLKRGEASSLTEAHLQIARLYGFASWPKLKAHVESLEEIGALEQAIDTNDLNRVVAIMTANPTLHRAPLGYGKNGPLTWVAECRIPWEPPRAARLAMAQWMIDHGSDVHQGGDGPLMRAALNSDRIAMMELLVRNGSDVNAAWSGRFPIIFAPCETLDPAALRWLLDHGAKPDTAHGTALDYVIKTYSRSPDLAVCIDILLDAGSTTKYDNPALLAMLRGHVDEFATLLDGQPEIIRRGFPELDFGSTAMRGLTLTGSTLLHVAAEYGLLDFARLLLDRGADVNALGGSGQTPLFHAVSQFGDYGIEVARLLLDLGAEANARARIPGAFDRPEEMVEGTVLGYAMRFPGEDASHGGRLNNAKTVALLRERGGVV